jgi:ABC-type nitrate/sulfonate/bicarbonate transport system substrate-binding protein
LEGRYERLETSYDYHSLLRGDADVFNAYSTNEPFQLEQAGVDYHVIDPNDYGIHFYGEVLFTTRPMTKERPDDVIAFRDASFKGWAYALAHVDETIDLIKSKYGVEKSRAALIREAEAVSRMIQSEKVAIGEQNIARWAQITHHLIAIDAVRPEYHIDAEFIFTPPERLSWQQLQPWILGFSAITLILLAFVSV